MTDNLLDDILKELTIMLIREHEKKDDTVLILKKENLLKSYIKLIKLIKKYKY